MEIEKSQIVELLKSRGEDAKAAQAETDLPDKVDTDADASVLAEVGIDPQDLLGDLPGGLV
jgi:leucyl aminopeptidase (aminopeptidase T)